MEKIITFENLKNFAYLNDEILKKPIKGILLTFKGLNFTDMYNEAPDEAPIYFAEKGILNIIPYFNPWCWMNRQAVNYIDEIIDVVIKGFNLPEDIPIVSSGFSMGGLCAIVYTAYAKKMPKLCIANCPVCDLPFHYTERPDLPRTLYSAFGEYDCDLQTALKSASPVHLVDKMPDTDYCIFHCEKDNCVNMQKHSNNFVEKMRKDHNIEYFTVPERGHCSLTPEMKSLFNEKIVDAINE